MHRLIKLLYTKTNREAMAQKGAFVQTGGVSLQTFRDVLKERGICDKLKNNSEVGVQRCWFQN